MAKTKIPEMTPDEKRDRVCVDLLDTQPFWGYLLAGLDIRPDPTCKTAWVDGVSLGYNPAYIATLTLSKTKTVFAHEADHPSDGHCWRIGDRDLEVWNIACDHNVNNKLLAAGFEPLDNWYCDPKYAGKSPEWIYSRLIEEREKKHQQQQQRAQQQSQNCSGQGAPAPPQQSQPQQPNPNGQGAPQQSAQGPPQTPAGEQPDAQNGQPQAGQGADFGGCGELRPAPPEAANEGVTEAAWQQRVLEAAAVARGAGKLPAHCNELIDRIRHPQGHWRKILDKWFDELTDDDYSWSTPDVDFIQWGIYLPDLESEQLGAVIFASDVSGSITTQEFTACLSEVIGAIEQCQPEISYLIQFDSGIREFRELKRGADFGEVRRMGSGGTCFRPVFDLIEEKNIKPAGMVFLTDLEPCDAWPDQPDYPVLWVSTNESKRAPWGETIYLNDGGIS